MSPYASSALSVALSAASSNHSPASDRKLEACFLASPNQSFAASPALLAFFFQSPLLSST